MRITAAVAVLLACSALSGCSNSTSPTSGSPSGSPTILAISPAQPSLSESAQLITIQGHDFDSSASATLTRPDGRTFQFTGSEVRQLTTTSFILSMTLDVSGPYQLQVANSTGLVSVPFTFTVSSASQGSLTLISVSPISATASSQPQAIFVQGTNFDATLQAILTAPDSTQNFYTSAAMLGLNSTSFTLNATLNRVGVYSLVVTNSSNSISNSLTINVTR
jgi:hypothetical protein